MGCQIVDAKFYVKESSGGATVTAYMYPIYNTTWTESGLTWNNIGNYSTAGYVSETSLKGNTVCCFDVKSYLQGCKSGSYNLSGGLLIKSGNETILKSFYSSEYGTSSYRPYVTVTYIERSYIPNGTYILNSLNLSGMITPDGISNGDSVSHTDTLGQSQSRWIITNIGDNFCTIRSQYSNKLEYPEQEMVLQLSSIHLRVHRSIIILYGDFIQLLLEIIKLQQRVAQINYLLFLRAV